MSPVVLQFAQAHPTVLLLAGALLGSVATWFGARFFAPSPPADDARFCPEPGCGHVARTLRFAAEHRMTH